MALVLYGSKFGLECVDDIFGVNWVGGLGTIFGVLVTFSGVACLHPSLLRSPAASWTCDANFLGRIMVLVVGWPFRHLSAQDFLGPKQVLCNMYIIANASTPNSMALIGYMHGSPHSHRPHVLGDMPSRSG